MGFLGLLYNPLLIFIALFVWIGATAEAQAAQIEFTLAEIPVGRAMLTEYRTLLPEHELARAVELTLAGSQKDFPVVVGQDVLGVLTQQDLLKGLQADGERARVGDWMQREIPSARIDEPLEGVLERLRNCPCRLLTVLVDGRLAGIVNLDNFAEFLSIQSALQGRARTMTPRTASH
jgi:CBS domain-containing protein